MSSSHSNWFESTPTAGANAARVLGDDAKARDVLERALAIKERAYGRDHPDVAMTLECLGDAYGALGEKEKKASTLEKLGGVYIKLGDHENARKVLESALAIKERSYGRDHPELVGTLKCLEIAYGALPHHQHDKRDMQKRALAIMERANNPDHSEVVSTGTSVGGFLGDQAKNIDGMSTTSMIWTACSSGGI